jgi:hypothetical protein
MATLGSSYHYSPLGGSDMIRLVEILPAQKSDSELQIRFLVRNLHSHPVYQALSYLWGSIGPTRTVLVDSTHISITENLYCFLMGIRKSYKKTLFWIDALSINQLDGKEKTQTISLMPEIYKLATRTICWIPVSLHPSISRLLGRLILLRDELKQLSCLPSLSSVSRLLALFQLSSDKIEIAESLVTDSDPYHSDINVSALHFDLIQEKAMLSDERAWRELNKLLENPYFTRYVNNFSCSKTDFVTHLLISHSSCFFTDCG